MNQRKARARAAARRGEPRPSEELHLGAVIEFMRLLWAVDHGLQSASKRMRQRIGLTGPQRLVVRIVGRFPAISAGHLASVLHVHPSTLTGVLRRLEAAGVVERRIDTTDGRRALFTLTGRGRALDKMRSGTVEARIRSALARQPRERILAAQDLLAAIAEELEKS